MSVGAPVVPADGAKITIDDAGKLTVPNNPIIPFIEGDGIGVDITPVMIKVVDAAVERAYGFTNETWNVDQVVKTYLGDGLRTLMPGERFEAWMQLDVGRP